MVEKWRPTEKYSKMEDPELYQLLEKIYPGHHFAPAVKIGARKTGASFDCTTICPKHVRGTECPYCYVGKQRKWPYAGGKKGPGQAVSCSQTEDNIETEIKKMSKSVVEQQNKQGGLRLFQNADYIKTPYCDNKIDKLVKIAKKKGLKLKAVTKQPDFIKKHGKDMNVVNVSVDSIGTGMDWDTARKFVKEKDNVFLRIVALNPKDLEQWGHRLEKWGMGTKNDKPGVITLYHNGKAHPFCKKDASPDLQKQINERSRKGQTTGYDENGCIRFKTMKDKEQVPVLKEKGWDMQTCCGSGTCGTCKIACSGGKCSVSVIVEKNKGSEITI